MRITHEIAGKQFALGYDHVTGVFVQVKFGEELHNWSEFSYFNKRLTHESIVLAIKEGIFTKDEFDEIASIPFGEEFTLYYSSIITTKEVGENFKYPKALVKHYQQGKGFKVSCLADHMKILKHFKEPVTYVYVEWYKGIERIFEFENDYALQFCE